MAGFEGTEEQCKMLLEKWKKEKDELVKNEILNTLAKFGKKFHSEPILDLFLQQFNDPKNPARRQSFARLRMMALELRGPLQQKLIKGIKFTPASHLKHKPLHDLIILELFRLENKHFGETPSEETKEKNKK